MPKRIGKSGRCVSFMKADHQARSGTVLNHILAQIESQKIWLCMCLIFKVLRGRQTGDKKRSASQLKFGAATLIVISDQRRSHEKAQNQTRKARHASPHRLWFASL